jgi:hypothetical protein
MLGALFAVGTEGIVSSVMGNTTLPAYRADLTYRVISAEQDKPISLPTRGKYIARCTDGDAGNGNGSKRRLPCNRADRGCVASWGQHHLAGNGADFPLVLKLETS